MEESDDGVTNTVVAIVTRNKRNRSRRDDESNGGEMSRNVAPTASNGGETAAVIKTIPATKNSPDAASKQFLSNNLKSSNPNYRIQRELKAFLSSPPPGLSVKISGRNVRLWIVTLTMPSNTIYAGETYRLRIQFPADYPTSPPSVYFLPPTPRHEHVYTNGDICLSLLGTDWRPIMTAQSVAQAIMSILCGAQRKSLPMDNARHAGNKPGKKQNDWVYHDDNC
jgi:ubiquitin-conjugating enzyme E2 W